MSYQFIATSDNHLGKKLYNMPELAQDARDSFRRICQLALEKQVTYLVIVGDLFDSNEPTPEDVEFVARWVATLEREGIVVTGIAGDHDKNINGKSWTDVVRIAPLEVVPQFIGCDYSDKPEDVLEYIKKGIPNHHAEWMFLHGQVPSLFKFVDAKKKLDLESINLFESFPKLQGVVLGDIHAPVEQMIISKGRSLYVGYCSSPIVGDLSEFGQEKRVLWFDGKTLNRIPVTHNRAFVKIPFTGFAAELFDVTKYMTAYRTAEYKPVFIIEYDTTTEEKLHKTAPLYDIGLVRKSKIMSHKGGTQETVNIRSSLQTKDRIPEVLTALCPDKLDYDLAYSIVMSADPKPVLDEFKAKALA